MTGPAPRLPVWRGASGARVGGRLAVALAAATVLVLAASGAGAPAAEHAQGPVGTFTERFAVELHPGADPDAVARELHMENLGQIGSLANHYHMRPLGCNASSDGRHRQRHDTQCVHLHEPAVEHHGRLRRHSAIRWVQQQHRLRRERRMYVPDPLYSQQWFLEQSSNQDIDVMPVWDKGITGKGAVVCVCDDGVEHDHTDLRDNYDPAASTDLNGHDSDPYPNEADPINKHGTRCCGEVAAAKNSKCGIGIAYEASFGAVRMLDGDVTDSVEAHALSLNPQHIDIYSSSWGPNDDGRTVEGPAPLCQKALSDGATGGRGGLGSIYVFASGNGGSSHDSCGCDGYVNSIYTIAIGAVTENGRSPWYAEQCSSQMAVTYSSGSGGERAITTVDLHNSCTNSHSGTSAAAPIAAGIFALVLQANPGLGWRDMQHLIVHTAQMVSPDDSDWATTKAGHKVNHKFGFGRLNADKMVTQAQHWTNVGPQLITRTSVASPSADVPHASSYSAGAASSIVVAAGDTPIRKLEHIQVTVDIDADQRGDLAIVLACPSGTLSTLVAPRPNDYSRSGLQWTFMTTRCWDESAVGQFTLYVYNGASYSRKAFFRTWQLTLYGNDGSGGPSSSSSPSPPASSPTPPPGPVCAETEYVDPDTKSCVSCDSQCAGSCTGAGPTACEACAHYRDGDTCVGSCGPSNKYADGQNVCQPCDVQCLSGCTGPSPSECLGCAHVEMSGTCVAVCPPSHYAGGDASKTCLPCHTECSQGCSGPEATACVACKNLVDGATGECVAECGPGLHRNGTVCVGCHAECDDQGCRGPTATDCLGCRHYSIAVDGAVGDDASSTSSSSSSTSSSDHTEHTFECVAACPTSFQADPATQACVCADGTYLDITAGLCQPCSEQCATGTRCSGPDAASCIDGCHLAQSGDSCVAACPAQTFASTDASLWAQAYPSIELHAAQGCLPCHTECASGCSGLGADECTGGCRHSQLNGTCVAACPTGTYTTADNTCVACDDECAGGCHGAGPSACLACQHLNADGRCVSACPDGQYPGNDGKTCRNCHPQCAGQCFGPGADQCCARAASPQAAVCCEAGVGSAGCQPSCDNYVAGRECVTACAVGYYVDSASKSCRLCDEECLGGCTGAGPTLCHECRHFVFGDTCVAACPNATHIYSDASTRSCGVCDPACGANGCTGPTASDCRARDCTGVSCPLGFTVGVDCACVEITCGADQVKLDGLCRDACPTGTFASPEGVCEPCDTLCGESGCTAGGPAHCLSCAKVLSSDGHECLAACPANSTFEDANGHCMPCHEQCEGGCGGPEANQCTRCAEYSAGGACVAVCPEGSYVQGKECRPCDAECSGGCHGPGPDACAGCLHYRQDGVCVSDCPSGMFPDANSACAACSAECLLGCTGVGADQCLEHACVNFLVSATRECVARCSTGTYVSAQRTCEPCDPACAGRGCIGAGPTKCSSYTALTTPPAVTTTATPPATTTASANSGDSGDSDGSKGDDKSSGSGAGLAAAVVIGAGAVVLLVIGLVLRFRGGCPGGARFGRAKVTYSALLEDDEDDDIFGVGTGRAGVQGKAGANSEQPVTLNGHPQLEEI